MKKILSAMLVLSLVLHYPSLSAEASSARLFNNHSSLPISKVRTFWFIPNTQTGTMAYRYPCGLDCIDNKIVSLMLDINVVVYMHGPHSYWIDTQTGCHYVLPSNQPKHGENECNDNQEKDPLIYDFNNGQVIFNPLVKINQTDNLNI
tara:strand:+ start:258 stop:701 length:444 start_codon:yes stop_codon:yes gene_type:complete